MKLGQQVPETPDHPAGFVVTIGKNGYFCRTRDGKRFTIPYTKKPSPPDCPHLNKTCRFLYDGLELVGIFVNARQVRVLQHPIWANSVVTPKRIIEMLG